MAQEMPNLYRLLSRHPAVDTSAATVSNSNCVELTNADVRGLQQPIRIGRTVYQPETTWFMLLQRHILVQENGMSTVSFHYLKLLQQQFIIL